MADTLEQLQQEVEEQNTKLTEIGATLVTVGEKQVEGFDEVTRLIADLQNSGKVPEGLKASFATLVTKISALQASSNANLETARKIADIVPDAPPPTP